MTGRVEEDVVAMVAAEPGVTLAELIERVPGATIGSVGRQIVNGEVYVDLGAAFLGEPERVRVFSDKTRASFFGRLSETQVREEGEKARAAELVPGTSLLWDGVPLRIVHVGRTELSLRRENGDYVHFPYEDFQRFMDEGRVTRFVAGPGVKPGTAAYDAAKHLRTEEEMLEALWRYDIIKPLLNGEPVKSPCPVSDRTVRTWVKDYKSAELKYRNGLLGLVSRTKNKGNRTARLDPRIDSLIAEAVNHHYATAVKLTKIVVYGFFQGLCIAAGILTPPSYKTFIKRIKQLHDVRMTEKRDGSKVAYQEAEFLDHTNLDDPVHGDRPWEYAHIDHTLMDEELLHSSPPRKNMGRAWLTLMVDAFTRRVLAYYVTYDPPSYRSNLGVMRECVRKHGRLPEHVIVDCGKDLASVYFERLCARFNVDIIRRPPTKPRFGAIIERLIHTINKQLIHNLRGNTKATKNARQVTPAVNPKNLTVWDLPMLDEALGRYLYEEYDNRWHSELGMSPREAHDAGVAKYGIVPERIPYDESFIMDTLPSTKSGFATVRKQRGVQLFGIHYKANQLRNPEIIGTKVELRYDPYNMAVVYARVKDQWVACHAPARIYRLLRNRSEKEMRLIFEEERQKFRAYGRNFNARAKEMALQQAEREQSEAVAEQRLRDEELRKIGQGKGDQHSTVSRAWEQPRREDTGGDGQEDRNGGRRSERPKVFGRAKRAA